MHVYLVRTKYESKVFSDFNILCFWLQRNVKYFHPFDKDIMFENLHVNRLIVKLEEATVELVELIRSYPDRENDTENKHDDCFGSTD